ncbi:Kinesin-like protein KIF19 [Liparis tanakae]|uniref:Kinesin-like protein KIF19 n=1 Tax=Liparis tanakae TaxID=230148 RepID=A0A4Z2FI88_9TELE|nr:Kinesin-like protein KIF19 [Liparis tanakae]
MKDTGESKEHQLTVALRIRPLSDAEQEETATIVAHRVDDQTQRIQPLLSMDHLFCYAQCFFFFSSLSE